MESPVSVEVRALIPFGTKVKMFLHSRRCERCRVAFWAALAMEYSTKAITSSMRPYPEKGPDAFKLGRPNPLSRLYMIAAVYASKRRAIAQRAIGMVPFEDMNDEQRRAAIAEIQAFQQKRQGIQPPRLH